MENSKANLTYSGQMERVFLQIRNLVASAPMSRRLSMIAYCA